MQIVTQPFINLTDLDGSPLDNGALYFGVANGNPESTPITVYWDEAGTQPAVQPIKTLNGYPVNNGVIANIWSAVAYAMTIRNAGGELVAYLSTVPTTLSSGGLSDFPPIPVRLLSPTYRLVVSDDGTEYVLIPDTFLNLTDVLVNTFVGKVGQVLVITAGGVDSIPPIDLVGITDSLIGLSDGPGPTPGYVGQKGKSVVVDDDELGFHLDGYPVGDGCWALSGVQPVTAGVDATLNLSSVIYDKLKRGTFNTSTFTYTAGATGADLQVSLTVGVAALAAGGPGTLDAWSEKNSLTRIASAFAFNFASGTAVRGHAPTGAKNVTLAAGETLRCRVNCGANQNIDSGADRTFLSITELR